MLYKIAKKFLICLFLLFAISCAKIDGNDSRIILEYTKDFSTLSFEDLDRLSEFALINIWEKKPVSIVALNALQGELVLINEIDQEIVNLNIETKEIVSRHKINKIELKILGIDKNGKQILAATETNHENLTDATSNYLNSISVIDTNDGSMIECLSISCDDAISSQFRSTEIDGSISFDGDIIVLLSEELYSTISLKDKSFFGIEVFNAPDEDYQWHIGKVAIDSKNNRLALIFEEGRVELRGLTLPSYYFLDFYEVLEDGTENNQEYVQSATFDESGRLLAFVRGNYIYVWHTFGWKKEIFRFEVGKILDIKFNPLGDLLFVLGVDKILIFDFNKNLKFEMEAYGITSLDISDDNRLIIWGDNEGDLHILGIPKP